MELYLRHEEPNIDDINAFILNFEWVKRGNEWETGIGEECDQAQTKNYFIYHRDII
jgi:hypothetical protein